MKLLKTLIYLVKKKIEVVTTYFYEQVIDDKAKINFFKYPTV